MLVKAGVGLPTVVVQFAKIKILQVITLFLVN
jgi:hypothetical protein